MATGTETIDFGADPADEVSVSVTTSGLGADDHIEAFVMLDSTDDNDEDEHEMLATLGRFACKYVSATEFTLKCELIGLLAIGEFKVRWAHAP